MKIKVAIGIILYLAFSSIAHAEEYVIGVEQVHYYPYHDYDKNRNHIGFSRELFDLFAKEAGILIRYQPLPVERLFIEFLKPNSPLDFKYPDHPFWRQDLKKNHMVEYSHKVVGYTDGVIVLPKNQNQGLESLKLLGSVRGFKPWTYLEYIEKKQIKLTENDSFIGLLEQTLLGRVQGAYINLAVAQYHLEQQMKKPHSLVFNEKLPHTNDSYTLSTIKHPELIKQFNEFLKKQAETIRQLKLKYKIPTALY